jgi:hypothetical protein
MGIASLHPSYALGFLLQRARAFDRVGGAGGRVVGTSPDEHSDIRGLRFIDPAYRYAHAGYVLIPREGNRRGDDLSGVFA